MPLSTPALIDKAAYLVSLLQAHNIDDIKELMGVSEKIAALNVRRYQDFSVPLDHHNAKPAIFSFKGDVYQPIQLDHYENDKLTFLNNHVRILSGLYGVLRPLDYLYPYRLEMGTKLHNRAGENLYAFWSDSVTAELNHLLATKDEPVTIDLASQEYSKVIDKQALCGRYITVDFKEKKQDGYRTIGIYAKKARGMMVDYVVNHHVDNHQGIKHFNMAGYEYRDDLSDETHYVFTRDSV